MLINVVWRTLSLENDAKHVRIIFDQIPPEHYLLRHRRRSRIRRILNRLRVIRRTNPGIIKEFYRVDETVTVTLTHAGAYTLFCLIWPPEHPPYRIDDNSD
jgi:hypothetical protein